MVCIDKCGIYVSVVVIFDVNVVIISDYVVDVYVWVMLIWCQIGVKCVWVLGYSEGGLVVFVVGCDSMDICGFVLVLVFG